MDNGLSNLHMGKTFLVRLTDESQTGFSFHIILSYFVDNNHSFCESLIVTHQNNGKKKSKWQEKEIENICMFDVNLYIKLKVHSKFIPRIKQFHYSIKQ